MMAGRWSRALWLTLALIATLAACWLGVAVVHGSSLTGFGFNNAPPSPGTTNAAWPTGAMTILGVVASLLVDLLRAQDPTRRVNFANLLDGLLRPQTFIALCVSPVVLFGAMLAVEGKELGPALYLAPFQNGFFWQKVLDLRPRTPLQGAPATPAEPDPAH